MKRDPSLDEGSLKTPIPKCRLYWSFLCGVVGSNFVSSESGQRQSAKFTAEYGLQHNLTSPQSHTLSVYRYSVRLLWERGGGDQRDGREARGVENTNVTDCISSL
jgi:hypothetical protein